MPIRIAIIKDWNALYTLEQTDQAQRGKQDNFPQDKIRALVARMAAINTLIIKCEGENEFHS